MTTVDYAHTGVALENRRVKAAAIAAWCWDRALAPEVVGQLPEAVRRRLARAAGVEPGSWETWALVVSMLEQKTVWADAHSGDPRAGRAAVGDVPGWLFPAPATVEDPSLAGGVGTDSERGMNDGEAPDGAPNGWGAPPRGWPALVQLGPVPSGARCSVTDCIQPAVAPVVDEWRCADHPPRVGEWGHGLNWTPNGVGKCAPKRCYCGRCPSFTLSRATVLADSAARDEQAIASGKKRAGVEATRAAKAAVEARKTAERARRSR